MPDDDVYMPIHVGREGKEDLGYLGDNTGDNISSKNANYCELTGLYWAWKNLKCDYIGLCHYRRYFAGKNIHGNDVEKKKAAILKRQDYEKLLQEYDVILPVKRNYYIETVRSQYEARVFGFIAERLLNVWFEKQQLKVKEMSVVFLEKQNWPKKITEFLKRKWKRGNI